MDILSPNPESNCNISIVFMGRTMLFDSSNFCCCCLANDSLVPMANPGQKDGTSFQRLYDSMCPLTIQYGGPLKICDSCIVDLQMAVQFRHMCRQANVKLKEIVLNDLRKKKPDAAVAVGTSLPNMSAEDIKLVIKAESEIYEGLQPENTVMFEPIEVKTESELFISHVDNEMIDVAVQNLGNNELLKAENEMDCTTTMQNRETLPKLHFCGHCGQDFNLSSELMLHLDTSNKYPDIQNPCKGLLSKELRKFHCDACRLSFESQTPRKDQHIFKCRKIFQDCSYEDRDFACKLLSHV
jgi:Zinc-finger associated domain (zf-AD)